MPVEASYGYDYRMFYSETKYFRRSIVVFSGRRWRVADREFDRLRKQYAYHCIPA